MTTVNVNPDTCNIITVRETGEMSKKIYKERGLFMFNQEQINFIKSLGMEFDFNNLSGDDIFRIEDSVATELQFAGFDENHSITNVGEMCESILDSLA